MALYNMTTLQESETIFELVQTANTFTGDILISLTSWAIFFIMFMVMKRFEFDDALLASSSISFVITMLFNYMELVPLLIPLAFLTIAGFTAFYTFVIKR